MSQQQKIIGEKSNKLQNIFLCLTMFVTLLSVIARLFWANTLVDKSVEISKIDQQIELLETENKKLAGEIREMSSLTSITTRAQVLGFVKNTHYAYLEKPKSADIAWILH